MEGPAFCGLALQLLPMAGDEKHYYVYIVASISRVLYCGVTNDIAARVGQHRTSELVGFTSKCKCTRLVWYESYRVITNAIAREKQIKRWRREKKLWLIVQKNPNWIHLSEKWARKAGPSTALLFESLRSG